MITYSNADRDCWLIEQFSDIYFQYCLNGLLHFWNWIEIQKKSAIKGEQLPVYWIHTVLCRALHRTQYRVDCRAIGESLCFNSSSVVGRANASKWKTWQWVRFPAAGFNLHVSFSAQNKALELQLVFFVVVFFLLLSFLSVQTHCVEKQ